MDNMQHIPDREFIFGALLLVANKMDTQLERSLSQFNVTAKQWFLLLVVFNIFTEAPTIKELARAMGSSHQNVKQVALKLEEKGMVNLKKDPKDARVTRVYPTPKSYEFWQSTDEVGSKFMETFFHGIDGELMHATRKFVETLMLNLSKMETVE